MFKTSVTVKNKLRVAYNNSLRRLLSIHKRSSASELFVNLSIPSFGELFRIFCYNFMQRLNVSNNGFIIAVVNSHVPFHSDIWHF